MMDQNAYLKRINKYIDKYDNIYVIKDKNFEYEKFFQDFSQYFSGNCLVLAAGMDRVCSLEAGMDIQEISYEEYCEIEKLYFLYEFSDHVHILAYHTQFGTLANYIKGGLLTEDEAAMALLK